MNAAQERAILMDEREKQFGAMIREYLMDNGVNEFGDGRKFRFGGAVNLLATVRIAFSDAAKETGVPAYQRVASELERIEMSANVDYTQREVA